MRYLTLPNLYSKLVLLLVATTHLILIDFALSQQQQQSLAVTTTAPLVPTTRKQTQNFVTTLINNNQQLLDGGSNSFSKNGDRPYSSNQPGQTNWPNNQQHQTTVKQPAQIVSQITPTTYAPSNANAATVINTKVPSDIKVQYLAPASSTRDNNDRTPRATIATTVASQTPTTTTTTITTNPTSTTPATGQQQQTQTSTATNVNQQPPATIAPSFSSPSQQPTTIAATTAAATTTTTTVAPLLSTILPIAAELTTSQQQNSACTFKGRSYGVGEKWFDDCVSKCQCVLAINNVATIACEDRCEKYIDIMPSNCLLQRSQDDECCLVKVCPDSTLSPSSADTSKLTVIGFDGQTILDNQQQDINSNNSALGASYSSRQQQTSDDYSQTPITVTDIKLKPQKTTTVIPNMSNTNSYLPTTNQNDFVAAAASTTTTTTTTTANIASNTNNNSGNRLPKHVDNFSPNNHNNNDITQLQYTTNNPALSNQQYQTIKQQQQIPTQTLRPVNQAYTGKSSSNKASDNAMSASTSAPLTTATPTTTPTPATTAGKMIQTTTVNNNNHQQQQQQGENQQQDLLIPHEDSSFSLQNMQYATPTNDAVEVVDGNKEDLCIVDEHTVYRINQLVEFPDCNKKCRCQYSPIVDVDSFSNCTSAQQTINLYRPNGSPPRLTEIVCDNQCEPIVTMPSRSCLRPKCNALNVCSCPYLTCEETLPLHAYPEGIVPPEYATNTRYNRNSSQLKDVIQDNSESVKSTLTTINKCVLKGRELAINETYDDECHSRCKCTEKLQVQCEALTCPSKVPPPSSQCTNWAYDVNFRPEAPDCCPPLICKDTDDGSCLIMGVTIKHLQPLPEEINGCPQQCLCIHGTIQCEPTCTNSDRPTDLMCPDDAMPVLERASSPCQCPRWVCPVEEDLSLRDVTVKALNETAIRVRFTLPQEAMNLKGYAELNYTMDNVKWTSQKFTRPGRLFDSIKIEYILNKFHPGTTYFFKIRVLFEESVTERTFGPLESSIIKLQMPTSIFEQPKPPFWNDQPSKPPNHHPISPAPIVTTTSSTTTTTTTTSSTTPSPPREMAFDFNLTARSLNSEVLLVQWHPLTTKERQYIESYQIKYWIGTMSDFDDVHKAKVSQLLHKETDRTLIHDLQSNMNYSLALIVNQPTGVPVKVNALNALTYVKTQQKLEGHESILNPIEQSFQTKGSEDIIHEEEMVFNQVTKESSRVIFGMAQGWPSKMKKQLTSLFKVYYKKTPTEFSNQTRYAFVEPKDGQLIIDNLAPDTEYEFRFEVILPKGLKLNPKFNVVARTDAAQQTSSSEKLPITAESSILFNVQTNTIHAWYLLLSLTGLMTVSFTIVLYLLLKKSSSAIAPISSQSAYDNPSFTKLVSYYEPPCGVDPNNNNLDSSMKPPPMVQLNNNNIVNGNNMVNGNNGVNMNNNSNNIKNNNNNSNNNNNNNSHPYNAGWEFQRPEGRLI